MTFQFSVALELAITIRQENKIKAIKFGGQEVKLSLYIWQVCHAKNEKNPQINYNKLILQLIVFIYISTKWENKIF